MMTSDNCLLSTFHAELELRLAKAAAVLGDVTSFYSDQVLSAYKDKLLKWEVEDNKHKQVVTELQERILENDKEKAVMSSALEAHEAEKQSVSREADNLKSRCHEQEQHIKELMAQAESTQAAHLAQVKQLQEQLEAALAYRRKCQSLQKELEKTMGLLASQEAGASAVEQDILASCDARPEEAPLQWSVRGVQALQLCLSEAELALKREQMARQQDLAAAADEKRNWQKQKEVLKAAYRQQNKLRKDLERKFADGDKLPGSPSTTITATPAPSRATDETEQLQDLSPQDARVLQPLNFPEQTPAYMTGSQSSTEAICRAAMVHADAACCPQTISSHNKQTAALCEICSMVGPAFDRVYYNPCAEEPAPGLSGPLLRDADPQGQPSASVMAKPAVLAITPDVCRPHARQKDDMDIDKEAQAGFAPAQENAPQQSPHSSSSKDVIDLSLSPDAKHHPQQENTAASTMPVGSQSPSSVARKAASKADTEKTTTHAEHRGAPRPWYQTPLYCPELPESGYAAAAKEQPTRHTVPPSQAGRVWKDANAQQRSHASSKSRLPPVRRKRKSPDLGEAAWAASPTAQPGSGACSTGKARNVASRPAAASNPREHSNRRVAHDQNEAAVGRHESQLQLSPDATQCSEPAPEAPTPKEALHTEQAPSEQLQGTLASVQCPSGGPPAQRPVWKSRGRKEDTGNGVAQTLHLLDMHQGLLRGVNVGASGGANGTIRLPTIVERAEAARVRPSMAAQPAPLSAADDPGYKYRDVVRKKAERELLHGFDCQDCKRFYEAVASWGPVGELPTCGHVKSADVARGQRPTIEQMRQDGSRHRYRYAPPATPEGFWDMGFLDSQDSRVQ